MTGGPSTGGAGGTSSSPEPSSGGTVIDVPQLLVAVAGFITILVGLSTSWLYLTGSVYSERIFSAIGLSRNILELDSKHFIINGYIEISHWAYGALGSKASLILAVFKLISLVSIVIMLTALAIAAVNKQRIAAGDPPIGSFALDIAQVISGVILLVPLSAFLIFGTALIFYLPEAVGAASAKKYVCSRYKLVAQGCAASPQIRACYDFSGPKITGYLIESDKTRSIILSGKGVVILNNDKIGIVTIHKDNGDAQTQSQIIQPEMCLSSNGSIKGKPPHGLAG